jgi:hypothetical protein
MEVRAREVAIGAGLAVLLAVAIIRMAVPDRSRLRPLSIEGLDIPSEPIAHGQRIVRETSWAPTAAVYILGWQYRIGAEALGTDLVLFADNVRLFHIRRGDVPANPTFFQNGGAYYVRPPQKIRLMYSVENTGPEGQTRGAGALVYFVPGEGN